MRSMTDEELAQYLGQWVEVRFRDGRTTIGKLAAGELAAPASPGTLAIEIPPAAVSQGPTWLPIVDVSEIEAVRAIERPPETID